MAASFGVDGAAPETVALISSTRSTCRALTSSTYSFCSSAEPHPAAIAAAVAIATMVERQVMYRQSSRGGRVAIIGG